MVVVAVLLSGEVVLSSSRVAPSLGPNPCIVDGEEGVMEEKNPLMPGIYELAWSGRRNGSAW